jgi:hypothetical protein
MLAFREPAGLSRHRRHQDDDHDTDFMTLEVTVHHTRACRPAQLGEVADRAIAHVVAHTSARIAQNEVRLLHARRHGVAVDKLSWLDQ